ncbi:MAG: SNF2-related protein, partial [Opitutaceae bacterium]
MAFKCVLLRLILRWREELVADEISPLSEIKEMFADGVRIDGGRAHVSPGNGRGLFIEQHNGTQIPKSPNGNGKHADSHADGKAPHSADSKATGPIRVLRLVFKTKSSGLTFQTYWLDADGNTLHPALGKAANGDNGNHVSSTERARLIGLAAYARKAHFHYEQETGTYTMQSLVEIPNFLKMVLPAWKKLFSVELDDKAEHLLKGTRAVEIEAVAERHTGSHPGGRTELNLRWIFRAGERMLTDSEISALTRHGGAPTIIPNIGIVALAPERFEAYRSWQQNVSETQGEGPLSPYLVFSLFSQARFKLTLTPEIESWRQHVLAAPELAPALPEMLRPYQRRGVEWLHHLCEVDCHGLLADEMGLGKTLQVLALLAIRPIRDLPSIIVCPASVVPVWKEEIAKFFPKIESDVLKSGNDFSKRKDSVLWLASYTQLRKHRALLGGTLFGYAVLDEGQFIKNPDAKTTQTSFAIEARHRIVLTGTPLENRQLDLWSI